jgi:hypothetical protein
VEESASVGEVLGGVVMLGVIASLALSVRVPRARIAAGLLLVGLAVAFAGVGVWRMLGGHHVYVVRWILFVSCTSAAGGLLFRWGRRTANL